MNYRRALLLAEKTISSAGTETIDIDVKDPISRLFFSWRVTKSKDEMDDQPCQDISKIELVDGSEVLHSLNGAENQALAIYNRRAHTMNHGQQTGANSNYSTYAIDFGRKLWDKDLAFLPDKFKNPQLKISHNLAISDTGATAAYLEVWAEVFDQLQIAPVGFLAAKEIKNFTTPASGSYDYTKLPTDRPIRQMLLRGFEKNYEPWYQLLEARLDEDNDKRVLFDMDLEDYHRFNKGLGPQVQEQLWAYCDTSATYYVTPTDYYTTPLGQAMAASYIENTGYARGGKVVLANSSGTAMMGMMVFGWLPNHCFQIPFGDQQDLNDWYNTDAINSLRLRLKAGSGGASGVGQIVLEQLRKY